MHRTQVSLDEPLYEELRRRAFERRISMAQMVREALVEYLRIEPEVAPRAPRGNEEGEHDDSSGGSNDQVDSGDGPTPG